MENKEKPPNVLEGLIDENDSTFKDFNILETAMSEKDMEEFLSLLEDGEREETEMFAGALAEGYQNIFDKIQEALESSEIREKVIEELDKKFK